MKVEAKSQILLEECSLGSAHVVLVEDNFLLWDSEGFMRPLCIRGHGGFLPEFRHSVCRLMMLSRRSALERTT